MAVFFVSHASALDGVRANGDAGSAQKTKPFGKLSLSLSLTLSAIPSRSAPPVNTVKAGDVQQAEPVKKAKTLGELNAEIAAIEESIKARQMQLEIVSASAQSPIQPSSASSPVTAAASSSALSIPDEHVSAEVDNVHEATVSGVASVASVMGKENPQSRIVAPNVPPAGTEKSGARELPGMDGMDWMIALAVPLLAVLGLFGYRKRKAGRAAKPVKRQSVPEAKKEIGLTQFPEVPVAQSSPVESTMKMPADVVQPQKQQSILPPEYEMLEEADIYLRFGHDKLAEEALREAIKINPKNPHAYLTLSRIYFSREDNVAFSALAQQLKSLGDESVWLRVAEMGRSLDADNPLYR